MKVAFAFFLLMFAVVCAVVLPAALYDHFAKKLDPVKRKNPKAHNANPKVMR